MQQVIHTGLGTQSWWRRNALKSYSTDSRLRRSHFLALCQPYPLHPDLPHPSTLSKPSSNTTTTLSPTTTPNKHSNRPSYVFPKSWPFYKDLVLLPNFLYPKPNTRPYQLRWLYSLCRTEFPSTLSLCQCLQFVFTRWGTADTEIKVPSAQNPELSTVPSSMSTVDQNITLHASPTARYFYLSIFCFPGSFTFIFPKPLQIQKRMSRTVHQTFTCDLMTPCFALM